MVSTVSSTSMARKDWSNASSTLPNVNCAEQRFLRAARRFGLKARAFLYDLDCFGKKPLLLQGKTQVVACFRIIRFQRERALNMSNRCLQVTLHS